MESATLTGPGTATKRLARLRTIPAAVWAAAGVVAMAVAALVGYLVYPTYPNYDSYYSLLWARELLHLQPLSFDGYRTPTEHPLAILVSLPMAVIGKSGDRVFQALIIASFVVLAVGIFRLGQLSFGWAAGAVAAVLLCTRLNLAFLAARGYIDIPYLAIVVWAAALELARPRRGLPVFLLLTAAALLRPEAWILMGAYWLWFCWHATWRQRVLYGLLAAVGPLVWCLFDLVATGDPLFSLHHTGDTAEELGRAKGLSAVPSATQAFLIRIDKLSVLLVAILGFALATWVAPRRIWMAGALFLSGLGTFVLVGVGGLSVIERYLLVPSLMVMVFAGVAIGGWDMLRPGTAWRRVWMAGGILALVVGAVFTFVRFNLTKIDQELRFRGDAHAALASLLADPAVRRAERCGAISTPTHKIIPDVRWLAGKRASQVVARSDPSRVAQRRARRGVALVITGRQALTLQVFVDSTVDPLVNTAPPGFRRIATRNFYAAYERC